MSSTKEKTGAHLSYTNPIDWLRLGWWLFMQPEQLAAYRTFSGDKRLKIVGTMLANLLLWTPLMIVALAFAVGALPYAEIDPAINPVLWPVLVIALWIWTVVFDREYLIKTYVLPRGRGAATFVFGLVLGLRLGLQLTGGESQAMLLVNGLAVITTVIATITAVSVARANSMGIGATTAIGVLFAFLIGVIGDERLQVALVFIALIVIIAVGFMIFLKYVPDREDELHAMISRLANQYTLILYIMALIVIVWLCFF